MRNGIEKATLIVTALMVLFWMTFWGAVIWAAVHFIRKLW